MIRFGLCLLAIFTATLATAQDRNLTRFEQFSDEPEPLDLVNLATLQELEILEDTYNSLLEADNCEDAIQVIRAFTEGANIAANLLSRGMEPFFDADREEQQRLARSPIFEEISAAESVRESLLRQRNRAWVEEARCLILQGRNDEGVLRLYIALDHMATEQGYGRRELWEEARRLLWSEIGYAPD